MYLQRLKAVMIKPSRLGKFNLCASENYYIGSTQCMTGSFSLFMPYHPMQIALLSACYRLFNVVVKCGINIFIP